MNRLRLEFRSNFARIDTLQDKGVIDGRRAILLTWVNNLEMVAREIVWLNNLEESVQGSIEELKYAFSVAQNYERRMIHTYGKYYKSDVEFGISRYNAILKQAGVNEEYFLGEKKE